MSNVIDVIVAQAQQVRGVGRSMQAAERVTSERRIAINSVAGHVRKQGLVATLYSQKRVSKHPKQAKTTTSTANDSTWEIAA